MLRRSERGAPAPLGKPACARDIAVVHSLPIFLMLRDRPVILIGDGPAADAKRRLVERAGARIVAEAEIAALAIVALDGEAAAEAAAARLRARGILVNVVDRPAWCDFTLPAIVDRDPVLIAIGTGGVSAGLAAALRQRLEILLPPGLGGLARALGAARARLAARWPDPADRRRLIGALLAPGAPLDPLHPPENPAADAEALLDGGDPPAPSLVRLTIRSADPDELTLRAARLLATADTIYHPAALPAAILDRARADARRIVGPAPAFPDGAAVCLSWEPE